MFQAIYFEKEVSSAPLTQALLQRYAHLPRIAIDHYGEVFNAAHQNFSAQKQHPSLILAQKKNRLVLPTPPGYGIGGDRNFYFSHMLNCIYDCRYCFLQGMYRSAHYVVFVNFLDFQQQIEECIAEEPDKKTHFFSGYDCDSLALETITGFIQQFLPFFESRPNAFLELRTKSTAIGFLRKQDPLSNVIVAYTLSPEPIVRSLEHRTPSLTQRLKALRQLQEQGWPIGLRFDPLIYSDNFEEMYTLFFDTVFQSLDPQNIHSISFGPFRLPKGMYKRMQQLYPDEKLFAHSLETKGASVSYEHAKERALIDFCQTTLLKYVPSSIIFPCEVPT